VPERNIKLAPTSRIRRQLRRFTRRHALALYVVAVVVASLLWRAFWTPDVIFLFFTVGFILVGQGKRFLRDFSPFVVILLVYDAMRGFADNLAGRVHVKEMIDVDRWLGGGKLPSERLQQLLWHGHVRWFDFAFYTIYVLHFVVPIAFGVYVWKRRSRGEYKRYVTTFAVLAGMGFLTYILFPAAPPWMASDQGAIAPLAHIAIEVGKAFGVHNYPTIYHNFNPNPVAAVPSLHVAFPTLFALFTVRFAGRKGLFAFLYPLLVATGVVYFGEHYVIDAIIGVLYAVVAYVTVIKVIVPFRKRRKRRTGLGMEVTAPVPSKLSD
jgi:small basic protein